MVTDVLQIERTREDLTCDSFRVAGVYGWPDQDIRYLSVMALEEFTIVVKPTTLGGARLHEFQGLAERWKQDTIYESSIEQAISHPAYQRIIAMGMAAVPLILEDLSKAPDLWFWALSAITGEAPEPEGSQGDVEVMAQAWLDWGKAKHFI